MRRVKEFDEQIKARELKRKPVPTPVPTSKKRAA